MRHSAFGFAGLSGILGTLLICLRDLSSLLHARLEIIVLLGRGHLILLLKEELVRCSSKSSTNERSGVKDPPAPDPNNVAQSTDGINNHRSEGSGGIDAAASEGDEDEMGDEDGPSNGDGGGIPSGRLGVHGSMKDSEDQQVCAHGFDEEGRAGRNARSNLVDAQSERRAIAATIGKSRGLAYAADDAAVGNSIKAFIVAEGRETGGAAPKDESPEEGAAELGQHVQKSCLDALKLENHEREGDGGVDVTSRKMADAVR